MRCPYCGHDDTRVLDSRPTEEGAAVRRRRECTQCGERFTTYEKVETTPFVVVKRDGRREAFDRDKIIRGVLVACEKRPVSLDQIEELVSGVEKELRSRYERELGSNEIGSSRTFRHSGRSSIGCWIPTRIDDACRTFRV